MKRISIHCFTEFEKFDVYLVDNDLKSDEGIQDLEQGLTYDGAKKYVMELVNKHNLSSSDKISICSFDEEEYLTNTKNISVIMFKELYL